MENNIESFDVRLDKYLRGLMTAEEEQEFIAELKADPEKLDHAQTLALAISQMKDIRLKQSILLTEKIKSMKRDEFVNDRKKPDNLNEFDKDVSDFISYKMTDYEIMKFKALVETNPQYEQRFKHYVESIGQTGIETTAAYKKSPIAIETEKNTRTRKWFRRGIITIAAACLIGFAMLFLTPRAPIETEGDRLCSEFAYSSTEGGVTRGKTSSLPELQELYDNVSFGQDMEYTAMKLEILYEIASSDTYTDYSDHANEIGWNAALAYIKEDNRTEAIEILNKIIKANPGKAIADRAKELIERIKKLEVEE